MNTPLTTYSTAELQIELLSRAITRTVLKIEQHAQALNHLHTRRARQYEELGRLRQLRQLRDAAPGANPLAHIETPKV